MVPHTKLAIAIALVCCVAYVHSDPVVGGLDEERPVTNEVRKVLASVEHHLKKKLPDGYSELKPISYRTQLVAGRNYFVRAVIIDSEGNRSHAHLRIYQPIRGANELTAIKTDVDERSPLRYFQEE